MSLGSSCVDQAPTPSASGPRICVAILLGAPPSRQNLERTGVPFLSTCFNVVVLNCLAWLQRSDDGLFHESAYWERTEKVGSSAELETALRRHHVQYAIDFIGLGPATPELQRVLARCGTRFVVQKSGTLPYPSPVAKFMWNMRSRKNSVSRPPLLAEPPTAPSGQTAGRIGAMLQRIRTSLAIRLQTRAPDIALLAGSASLNWFTRRAKRIVWTCSQDFHTYHAQQSMPAQSPEKPFAVFVDDNVAHASDWTVLGLQPPVTPESYFASMRRFLARVEAEWGMPVVIAAHPSARHDPRITAGFAGHKVEHGQTVELVRQAQAVLLHGSTAASFAVLGNKPLLFLTTSELSRANYGLHVAGMAREFSQVPLDIDSNLPVPTLASLAPDSRLYARYTDRYLCSTGTWESHPWEAFTRLALAGNGQPLNSKTA